MDYKKFLVGCTKSCGRSTSKKYAAAHGGACKACATGVNEPSDGVIDSRQARIIDAGWRAYATEEGHYSDGTDR